MLCSAVPSMRSFLLLCVLVACCLADGTSLASLSADAVFISGMSSDDAHSAARVELTELYPMEDGYITVDPSITESFNASSAPANYFFWFFEALSPVSYVLPAANHTLSDQSCPRQEVPVVLWLQGGPGCTSMEGLFMEMGPYKIVEEFGGNHGLGLLRNPHAWSNDFHMIFIDNPVGTGFSFVDEFSGLPTGQPQVAAYLENVLAQFFELFPEYGDLPFYAFGESYAGKYVPTLAYRVLTKEPPSTVNLVGLGIGDGFTNPQVQVETHAAQVFNAGLVDEAQATQIVALQERVVELCEQEEWLEAKLVREGIFEVIDNATDGINIYDYRTYESYTGMKEALLAWINQPSVRSVIHVGNHEMNETCASNVKIAMARDVMQSVADVIPTLLDNYKSLYYQGQFDARDGVASVEAMLRALQWDGVNAYLSSKRTVWSTNGVPGGYTRGYRNLTQVVVRNAGHLVPLNQGASSRDMANRFIYDLAWEGNRSA